MDKNNTEILLWEKALITLKEQLEPTDFIQSIEPLFPISVTNSTFTFGIVSEFWESFVLEQRKDDIISALNAVSNKNNFQLAFEYGEQYQISEEEEISSAPTARIQTSLPVKKNIPKARLSDKYTFDSFVIGDSNEIAVAAAQSASENPGEYNPLFLWGGTGLGKTHLMQAIGNKYREIFPSAYVEYFTCEELMNVYVDYVRKNKLHDFRDRFRDIDLLLIDDIQFLANKLKFQEEFFNLFNALYQLNKQIVLSSDREPCELQGLEDRLVSRFAHGVTIEINKPVYETRLAILKNNQETQFSKLPETVLELIAQNITSNIRNLTGALRTLIVYTSLKKDKSDITNEFVFNLLGKQFDKNFESKIITTETIQKLVAEHFNISVADILGKKRPKNIALPRQIAMYLSREETNSSYPELGGEFGGKKHATIMHAHKTIAAKLETEATLKNAISIIKRKLQKAN